MVTSTAPLSVPTRDETQRTAIERVARGEREPRLYVTIEAHLVTKGGRVADVLRIAGFVGGESAMASYGGK